MKLNSLLRSLLWPIKCKELTRLFPMFILFFLISFIYNLSRPIKLSLAVGTKNSGAEIIPFLKVWGILPSVIAFTYLLIFLSNRLQREYVFYIIVSIFIGFFACFSLFLYPNLETLTPVALTENLRSILPIGAKGLIDVIHFWPLSLFYILSELWGTIVLYTLFWGFANEITKMQDAKRFYSFFALSSNISVAIAGYLGSVIMSENFAKQISSFGSESWQCSLNFSLTLIVTLGLLVMLVFRFMHIAQLVDKDEAKKTQDTTIKKLNKKKMSLTQSISYVINSKYLLYIAAIVVCYNIATNLGETLWTKKMQEVFIDDKSAIADYIYKVTMLMGLLAIPIDLFITGASLRKMGWTFSALVTPVVFLFSGIVFYTTVTMNYFSFDTNIFDAFNIPIGNLIILFGACHIGITRACRNSIMDASKEIAYVPLSTEEKRKGKAVIDSISSRLGKAGGSSIYQILLISLGSMTATTPYIVGIVILLTIVWIYSVKKLGVKVKTLSKR